MKQLNMNRNIKVNGRFRNGDKVMYFDRSICDWATKDVYDVHNFIAEMPKDPPGLVEAFIENFIDIKL